MISYSLTTLEADLHEPRKRAVVARPTWEGPERPGDEFNRHHSEQEVLEWLGFTPSHTDHQGEHWTRPGKDSRDGSSATVYNDADGSHVTIWSDTVIGMFPALEVRRPYDAFGLFVGASYAGDYTKASRDLNQNGYGELPNPHEFTDYIDNFARGLEAEEMAHSDDDHVQAGWRAVDWNVVKQNKQPLNPQHFQREGGPKLLYPGRIHAFYGKPECMKSWATHVAVTQAIQAGGDCLILDCENAPEYTRNRMLSLGLTDAQMVKHLRYISPDTPYSDLARAELTNELNDRLFQIAVVDGVTDCMSLMGLDPQSNKDAAAFDHRLLRPLADNGAAVITVDHVAKNAMTDRYAFGAQHKLAAITGAAFYFDTLTPFGIGMHGTASLVLMKDKPGHLRKETDTAGEIAILSLKSNSAGVIQHSLLPPRKLQSDRSSPEKPPKEGESARSDADRLEGLDELLSSHPGT